MRWIDYVSVSAKETIDLCVLNDHSTEAWKTRDGVWKRTVLRGHTNTALCDGMIVNETQVVSGR